MVRQTNPRKNQQQKFDSDEIPLKAKRKEPKEKYRKKNNWLEEDDDDLNIDLYGEEDFNFEEELDSDFDAEYDNDFDK